MFTPRELRDLLGMDRPHETVELADLLEILRQVRVRADRHETPRLIIDRIQLHVIRIVHHAPQTADHIMVEIARSVLLAAVLTLETDHNVQPTVETITVEIVRSVLLEATLTLGTDHSVHLTVEIITVETVHNVLHTMVEIVRSVQAVAGLTQGIGQSVDQITAAQLHALTDLTDQMVL
jgi:hypothetical protein